MASTSNTAASQRIYEIVVAAGEKGIAKRNITKLTQNQMRALQRDAALRALEKAGQIECLKAPSAGRGRTARWYRPKAGKANGSAGKANAIACCGTCRFWIGGKCKRYPPVPYWPKMGADEWCGEYQVVGLSRQDG